MVTKPRAARRTIVRTLAIPVGLRAVDGAGAARSFWFAAARWDTGEHVGAAHDLVRLGSGWDSSWSGGSLGALSVRLLNEAVDTGL